MAESLIISVSGMRGVIGENLTPVIAAQYGSAFGTFLRDAAAGDGRRLRVCIGRDSRVSGQMLLSAVTAGLCSVGVDVVDLGLVTTPCVGIMLRELGCDGGIVITASHNPLPYNGIKLLLSNGMAPPAATAARIKQAFLDGQARYVGSVDCGTVSRNEDTDRIHVEKVLATIHPKQIAAKRFRIVLDSVNGAGARVAKKLLAEVGCEVIAMNDEPTGLFAHGAEPIAANLTDLCRRVRQEKADLGFAQDPDADRLAIVDENGVYIGEEYTLALAARHIFSSQGGTAAANLSTSRMIDDIAERAGAKVLRTPVGEAHVANAMIERHCVIGGEGNGGVIDLRVGPIRDSLVGMGLVLQLMADTGKSISGLVAEIGSYSMNKDKFSANAEQAKEIMKRAAQKFPDAAANTADGLRLDFPDAWIHLRTSNTEPVMRIIVEAKDEVTAKRYIQAVSEIRESVLAGSARR
jgi:phosphomannomutase